MAIGLPVNHATKACKKVSGTFTIKMLCTVLVSLGRWQLLEGGSKNVTMTIKGESWVNSASVNIMCYNVLTAST